jgi:hypothetical protein
MMRRLFKLLKKLGRQHRTLSKINQGHLRITRKGKVKPRKKNIMDRPTPKEFRIRIFSDDITPWF